jgi:putative DNA primase/helicase
VPICRPYMLDLLCKSARWMRSDGRKSARINPPNDLAQIILRRCGEWSFNPVDGIITTPTLRPDGTLLTSPGYDPATRLFLIDPPPMPGIPEEPTREDALEALRLLDGLLDEFPFADEASRSVAL